MIQPPFPSTMGAQLGHITFQTTKTAVRKNQENDGQTGSCAWTSQCLCNGEGGEGVRKSFTTAPEIGKNILFLRIFYAEFNFWLTVFGCRQVKRFFYFCIFRVFGLLLPGFCFIHFDATEMDLGYPGLWGCRPFLHRHTNVALASPETFIATHDELQLPRALASRGFHCTTNQGQGLWLAQKCSLQKHRTTMSYHSHQ